MAPVFIGMSSLPSFISFGRQGFCKQRIHIETFRVPLASPILFLVVAYEYVECEFEGHRLIDLDRAQLSEFAVLDFVRLLSNCAAGLRGREEGRI